MEKQNKPLHKCSRLFPSDLVVKTSAARNGHLETFETVHAFLKVTKLENKRKVERYELRNIPKLEQLLNVKHYFVH